MNNAELQRLFTTYGDRIFLLHFNDTKVLYIGYQNANSVRKEDISFVTEGGTEYIVVKRTDPIRPQIKWEMRWLTSYLESVGIMDADSVDYRPDPMLFR